MKQTIIQCVTALLCVVAVAVTSVVSIGKRSTAKLEATYNGVAVTDANAKVTLKTPDNTVGSFDINGIVTDITKVQISNVPLTYNEDNYHFEFSGSATANGKTINISGYVTYHLLVIDITDK